MANLAMDMYHLDGTVEYCRTDVASKMRDRQARIARLVVSWTS